jgi:DNA-binding Lrp family transcriptional regulator
MPGKRPPLLDRIDLKILALLQTDGRITIQKLAEHVGLSARACLERVRRLEAGKIITGYRALIEVERLSRPLTVFAEVALEKHNFQGRFEARLGSIEEAVECWQVSGSFDYLVRFICSDIARYEAVTADLIEDKNLGVARIVSNIALRPVRRFGGYPPALFARSSARS